MVIYNKKRGEKMNALDTHGDFTGLFKDFLTYLHNLNKLERLLNGLVNDQSYISAISVRDKEALNVSLHCVRIQREDTYDTINNLFL